MTHFCSQFLLVAVCIVQCQSTAQRAHLFCYCSWRLCIILLSESQISFMKYYQYQLSRILLSPLFGAWQVWYFYCAFHLDSGLLWNHICFKQFFGSTFRPIDCALQQVFLVVNKWGKSTQFTILHNFCLFSLSDCVFLVQKLRDVLLCQPRTDFMANLALPENAQGTRDTVAWCHDFCVFRWTSR